MLTSSTRALSQNIAVPDKFFVPLGSLKTEVGCNSAVEVGDEKGPVMEVGGEDSIVEL